MSHNDVTCHYSRVFWSQLTQIFLIPGWPNYQITQASDVSAVITVPHYYSSWVISETCSIATNIPKHDVSESACFLLQVETLYVWKWGEKIIVNVAGFTHAQWLSKVCLLQALLVFQVLGAFATDSYTDTPIGFAICRSVRPAGRPQVTIPEPVNGIISGIALGSCAKTIDIDCHRMETQLQWINIIS